MNTKSFASYSIINFHKIAYFQFPQQKKDTKLLHIHKTFLHIIQHLSNPMIASSFHKAHLILKISKVRL